MTDIKEFPVDSRVFFTKQMYQFKEHLKENKKIKIVATTINANQATRLAETLRRLGYIEFDDVKTETLIKDGSRQVRIIITVHVTADFDKLYKEHEEERKKMEEEKNKQKDNKKP